MENDMTQGNWQMPVEQAPKKNKFIIVTIVVLVVVVAVIVLQNKKEKVADIPVKKTYTTEEKIKILQNLSSARIAQQPGGVGSALNADGIPKPVAQVAKERTQVLQTLSSSVPKPTTALTDEEKIKILNSLSR